MGSVRSLLARYERHRFALLFWSLLLTLGAHPALNAVIPGASVLEALLVVNLVAAILSVARESSIRGPLAFGVAFVAVRAGEIMLGVRSLLPLSQALWVAASVLATASAVRYALRPGRVDGERIFAALDAYLLAGLVFGVCYWALELNWPGSFGAASTIDLGLARAIYFSFVTLATLGYGDIVPVSEPAQGLAILEAVAGQLYLTVLVARLVSLYVRPGDA
jgi:hypothetical protein